MPFADKFRAMMQMPFPGDFLEGFEVVSLEVGHEGRAPGQYAYPFRLRLRGAGGLAGLRAALKPLLARRCTTFSGFGTPYQLWFGRTEIEPEGNATYSITGEGAGCRVHLREDLARFSEHLAEGGALAAGPEERAALVEGYIAAYQKEIARQVGRYRRRIRRAEAAQSE